MSDEQCEHVCQAKRHVGDRQWSHERNDESERHWHSFEMPCSDCWAGGGD